MTFYSARELPLPVRRYLAGKVEHGLHGVVVAYKPALQSLRWLRLGGPEEVPQGGTISLPYDLALLVESVPCFAPPDHADLWRQPGGASPSRAESCA